MNYTTLHFSCSLSPTSAISYLCKHFTRIWWKSKLLILFLRNFADCFRNFAEFCGFVAELCGFLRNFTDFLLLCFFADFYLFFLRNSVEFCGLFFGILRICCGILQNLQRQEIAEVGDQPHGFFAKRLRRNSQPSGTGIGHEREAAGALAARPRCGTLPQTSYNGFTAFSVYCVFIVFTRNLNVE